MRIKHSFDNNDLGLCKSTIEAFSRHQEIYKAPDHENELRERRVGQFNNLPDCATHLKAINCAGHLSLMDFIFNKLWTTAICMDQGCPFLYMNLNVMPILAYDATNRNALCKRKNEAWR